MNQQTTSSGTNGHSTVQDIFALSDEQILEIDPDPQDVEVSAGTTGASQHANVAPTSALETPRGAQARPDSFTEHGSRNTDHENRPAAETGVNADSLRPAQASTAAPQSPPAWLAAQMNDTWNGADARALWDRVQASENEAAAYREVFAKPEDARVIKALYPNGVAQAQATAERARLLDEIDQAYFAPQAGTPEQARASRAQLAAMMLREDPAAFREMVHEGLRALEAADAPSGRPRSISDAIRRASDHQSGPQPVAQAFRPEAFPPSRHDFSAQHVPASPQNPLTPEGVSYSSNTHRAASQHADARAAAPEAPLAAYSAFEKAANAELEKTVGGAIDRALHQALPSIGAADRSSLGTQPSGSGPDQPGSLQARLSQAIREDVEHALQDDRQLGEQVAQVLAGRRLDDATRAQVVRLINDRALQLVPSAAKRALNEWTQATLAAHRSRTTRSEAANSRREVAAAATAPRDLRPEAPKEVARLGERNLRPAANTKSRINYHKLSDDQILDM